MRSIFDWFTTTNAGHEDIALTTPADRLIPDPKARWVRCADIAADPEIVYRWLCQLTVAPYSFDFIDMPGRRSPERLIPGAEDLRLGQPFMIFSLTDFVEGSYIAGVSRPEFKGVYGTIAVSYEATPSGTGCRLRATACVGPDLSGWRRGLLAVGDWVMAGQQLRRLKTLSERTASGPAIAPERSEQ